MNVRSTHQPPSTINADAVVVSVFDGEPFAGAAAEIDLATGGILTRLLERKELAAKSNSLTTLLAPAGVQAGQVVVVGLGRREKFGRGSAFRAAGAAAKHLAAKARARVAFYFDAAGAPIAGDTLAAAVLGSMIGCVGQDLYRAERKLFPIGEIEWSAPDTASVARGVALGEGTNLARHLVNEPPSAIYPEAFADRSRAMAEANGLEIEVWDRARLEAERCGSLLAVARGSARAPRLVILRHAGGGTGPTLALVGKGVTFDSGGLSLKPTDSMKTMKCDMAGAATVVGAMQTIARLRLPVNVIGLCGLVENMISGDAYRVGDVLTARSGKTIEVLNTDAEGRLVLADVLNVALERGAAKIVDLATLTGACVVALGNDVAGIMANDQAWCDQVAAAARDCGEMAWQLPMFPEYDDLIRSDVADIKNVGDGRWGGAITAAKFLEQFVGGRPWVHLDIAGPAFLEKPKAWLDGGASGAFVPTLVELAQRWA